MLVIRSIFLCTMAVYLSAYAVSHEHVLKRQTELKKLRQELETSYKKLEAAADKRVLQIEKLLQEESGAANDVAHHMVENLINDYETLRNVITSHAALHTERIEVVNPAEQRNVGAKVKEFAATTGTAVKQGVTAVATSIKQGTTSAYQWTKKKLQNK